MRSWLIGLLLAFVAGTSGIAQPVLPLSAAENCLRLVAAGLTDGAGIEVDFAAIPEAPTRLTSARLVEAAADVPAFCHVVGYIAPTIGIDLRLPVTNWNGKFAMIGCGGMCGAVPEQGCEVALIKGYACIQTDMGHRSTQTDAEWAYNNLEGEVDFGFRATHVVAVAGKVVTEVFYRKSPALSYFLGCSTGGRQGFVEAQKFPFDFNGILAGAPPLSEMGDGFDIIWTTQHTSRADGTPLLTKADLALVTAAALKRCDTDDGVRGRGHLDADALRVRPALADLQTRRDGLPHRRTGRRTRRNLSRPAR